MDGGERVSCLGSGKEALLTVVGGMGERHVPVYIYTSEVAGMKRELAVTSAWQSSQTES